MKKYYNIIVGLCAILVILIVIGLVGYLVSRPKPMTIQGEAEATEYRVSGKVPGRIEKLYFKEGDIVKKGDTLVMIDSPEVRAKLAQVEATHDMASALSRKADNGARKEQIAGAYQLWQTAVAQKTVMEKSYERMKNLYAQKVISAQKFDEMQATYDAAVAQERAAKSQYEMAVNGAREEDKSAAQALVRQADGALMEVGGYLAELYLTAQSDGIITSVYPKLGELVGTGAPIMTITDNSDMWFTFNIREDYLNGMKLGDKLTLYIPALNDQTVTATVSYISVRDSYATWKATKEIGQYDAKTFEVRAKPDEPVTGLVPGMSVIVKQ